MTILFLTQVAPENPVNGGDLRWWNLMEGDADVLCLGRRSTASDTIPGLAPFSWRTIHSIDWTGPVCQIGRWRNSPATFCQHHLELGRRLAAAIDEYRRLNP